MRLRQNLPARAVLFFGLSLTSALVVAVTTAVGGERSGIPARYRYAGVVETGRGAPAHQVASGDGIKFVFFDALSQGRGSERYRVCLSQAGNRVRCWRGTARYGLGRLVFPIKLPSEVMYGAVTARWFIGSRVVATWPFLYARGGA